MPPGPTRGDPSPAGKRTALAKLGVLAGYRWLVGGDELAVALGPGPVRADRSHPPPCSRRRERTVAGLKAARARGRRGGRKFALSKAQVRLAQAAMAHRDRSVSELCRERHQAGDALPVRRPAVAPGEAAGAPVLSEVSAAGRVWVDPDSGCRRSTAAEGLLAD